jgi:site-specific recombinase XerC
MGKPSGSNIVAKSQSPKEEIAKALAARGGSPALDVPFGSLADIRTAIGHVCFALEMSERGAPFTNRGFQAMVERAGKAAGFAMKIHPHMLRHACGYKLANDGVDTRTIQSYLGHKSIQHTVRYTELSPTRFKSLFRD